MIEQTAPGAVVLAALTCGRRRTGGGAKRRVWDTSAGTGEKEASVAEIITALKGGSAVARRERGKGGIVLCCYCFFSFVSFCPEQNFGLPGPPRQRLVPFLAEG